MKIMKSCYKKDEIVQKMGKSGHFFDDELSLERLRREAKEELGLDMRDFDYKYIGDYTFEFSDRIIYRSIFLIKTDLKETDFTVYEGAGAKYFNLEDAKKLKFPNSVDETIEIIKKHM